jgi:hypothetical protein
MADGADAELLEVLRRELRQHLRPDVVLAERRRVLADELWPKLGDGGVRKAAYRGG